MCYLQSVTVLHQSRLTLIYKNDDTNYKSHCSLYIRRANSEGDPKQWPHPMHWTHGIKKRTWSCRAFINL